MRGAGIRSLPSAARAPGPGARRWGHSSFAAAGGEQPQGLQRERRVAGAQDGMLRKIHAQLLPDLVPDIDFAEHPESLRLQGDEGALEGAVKGHVEPPA